MTRTKERASTILTEVGARRLTDRLVTTLTEAHELLIDLWVGRAWEALHYPNWGAFCDAELGDLLFVKLPPAMRREAAEHMKRAGMSYRNIAKPFGVSPASIHADLAPPKPESVQKLNTPRPRKTDRVVELIAAAGAAGLDVKAVQKALRCERHEASATLTRLHNARRIAYVEPQRRGMFGRYTATEEAGR